MERQHHKLAAILAADVVGYSALMEKDEAGTLELLKQHLSQSLEPALHRNGGRLVKVTGDGVLAEFGSAVDALHAAIEFQQAMRDANVNRTTGTQLVFRVGLHVSDVIVDGDDLYGSGVNIASRLETAAPPGGIFVSGSARDALGGSVKATFHEVADVELKNIARRVRVLRVEWSQDDWIKVQAAPPRRAIQFEFDNDCNENYVDSLFRQSIGYFGKGDLPIEVRRRKVTIHRYFVGIHNPSQNKTLRNVRVVVDAIYDPPRKGWPVNKSLTVARTKLETVDIPPSATELFLVGERLDESDAGSFRPKAVSAEEFLRWLATLDNWKGKGITVAFFGTREGQGIMNNGSKIMLTAYADDVSPSQASFTVNAREPFSLLLD